MVSPSSFFSNRSGGEGCGRMFFSPESKEVYSNMFESGDKGIGRLRGLGLGLGTNSGRTSDLWPGINLTNKTSIGNGGG